MFLKCVLFWNSAGEVTARCGGRSCVAATSGMPRFIIIRDRRSGPRAVAVLLKDRETLVKGREALLQQEGKRFYSTKGKPPPCRRTPAEPSPSMPPWMVRGTGARPRPLHRVGTRGKRAASRPVCSAGLISVCSASRHTDRISNRLRETDYEPGQSMA